MKRFVVNALLELLVGGLLALAILAWLGAI
jgi:hypothetical protein